MKKTITLVLSLAMILSLIAVAPVSAAQETVTLKLYRPIFSMSPQGTAAELEWQRLQEEKLGVKLNISWDELPYSEYNTKMPVYMAAGEWADAFLCTSGASTINEYGQTGMILNLKDYLKEDESLYLSMVSSSLKNISNVTAPDGGIYSFGETMYSQADGGAQACWAVRFDTFEKLGLKIPETLDELQEAAVALKAAYPASYPVYIGFNDLSRWLSLYQAADSIQWTGSEYTYAPISKAGDIETIIGYLAKLYGDGLIDPEFSSDTSDQYNAKCLNDSIFITSFAYHTRISGIYNANTEHDVTWGIFNAPAVLDGTPGFRGSEHEIGARVNGGNGIVINAATKYPELLMELCDYQYSDEMITLTNWGIENVTYSVNAEGEYNYTDEILNAPVRQTKLAEYGVNQSMSCRSGLLWLPQLNDSAIKLLNKIPTYYKGEFGEAVSWEFYTETRADFDNVLPVLPAMKAFDDLETEDINIHKTALDTFVREQYLLFITGERAMSEWANFIEEIGKYGDFALLETLYNSKIITQ